MSCASCFSLQPPQAHSGWQQTEEPVEAFLQKERSALLDNTGYRLWVGLFLVATLQTSVAG